MSSIKTDITSVLNSKIDRFITALHEQLGLEKDELYQVLNNLSLNDSSKVSSDDETNKKSLSLSVEVNKPTQVKKGKCEYKYTKGKQTGETCNVSTDGSKHCKKHSKDETSVKEEQKVVEKKEVKNTNCQYTFTKGKNQGTKCEVKTDGSLMCKKHSKEESESSESKTETKKEPKKESKSKPTVKQLKSNNEQKDKETINRLVSTGEKEVKKSDPVLSLSRNKFGNFEMVDTGLVFDPKTRQVIGTQNSNGNINELTLEDIELCKEYNFKYKIPEKLTSNKHSDDEEELDEEDLDEEELDDEELDEEEELEEEDDE